MTLWMAWAVLVSVLIAGAAECCDRVAARSRIPRRFVWIAALVASAVAPAAIALRPSAPGSAARFTAPPSSLGGSVAATPVPSVTGSTDGTPRLRSRIRALAAATIPRVDRWMPTAWVFASATWLLITASAVWRLRRWRKGWLEIDTEIGRVLVSRDDGPAVVGFVKPTVVVPQWTVASGASTRSLILRHELEHVRAHDSRVLAGVAVVLGVMPWNAALWWIARRLRLAIEIDCDARVIGQVGRAHAYGAMLVTIAERYSVAPPMSVLLSEAGAHLEARINAMTTPRERRPLLAAMPFMLVALGILATLAWTPLPPSLRAPVPIVRGSDPKPLRGNPSPRYPDEMRERSREGSVALTVSTDSSGIPIMSTLRVLTSSDAAFLSSVRSVLPQWRFDSAGTVRTAVRFMTVDTERAETEGRASAPVFTIDGIPVPPVVVITVPPVRRSERR